MRLDACNDLFELGHEEVVDREAACGVDDDDVVSVGLGLGDCALGDVGRVATGLGIDGDVEPLAEDLKLLDGGGTVDVCGDEEGLLLVVAFDEACELAGGGGFAGALKANHHDDGGSEAALDEGEAGVDGAHEGLEFVVADLDEDIAG